MRSPWPTSVPAPRHSPSPRVAPCSADLYDSLGFLTIARETPPVLRGRIDPRLPDHDSEYLDATKPDAPPNDAGEGPENGRLQSTRIEILDSGGAARLEALAVAVQALLGGGLTSQAKPLVDELVALIRSARGPRAEVISLASRRERE